MTDRVLTAIDAEIAELKASIAKSPDPRQVKLDRLQGMRKQYVGAGPSRSRPKVEAANIVRVRISPAVARAGAGPVVLRRPKSPETRAILQAVRDLIEINERPMTTTELAEALDTGGMTVPGKSPLNNLSAMLSNSGDFETKGRGQGWFITGKQMDTKPSSEIDFPAFLPPPAAE